MNSIRSIRRFLVVVLCITTLGLSACGSEDGRTQNRTSDNGNVLKVAFEGMTVPCNWLHDTDAHGAVPVQGSKRFLCGFEIDYMKKLCGLAGYRLEAYQFDWDGMLMAVATGKVDCAVSMIVASPDRAMSMDFTIPYYYGETVGVVRKNGAYASAASMEDLRGARATSMLNTLWYATQIDRVPDVNKLPALENVPALVVALKSDKVDLVLLDRPTAEGIIIANPDLAVLPFSGKGNFNVSDEETACVIALPKGREDLRGRLEAAMLKISRADVDAMVRDACRNQPLNTLR